MCMCDPMALRAVPPKKPKSMWAGAYFTFRASYAPAQGLGREGTGETSATAPLWFVIIFLAANVMTRQVRILIQRCYTYISPQPTYHGSEIQCSLCVSDATECVERLSQS